MAVGRAAHRGVPTRLADGHDSDFDRFLFRWGQRCGAIARRHERRYVDRMVKLADEGSTNGDFQVTRRGYTHGGRTNPRVIVDESD